MPTTLSFITLGSYLGATLGYLGYILFRPRSLAGIAYWLAVGGLGIHTVGLGLSIAERSYPFILSNQDAYALISWVVTALFLMFARAYQLQGAGAFILPAAASLMILSLFGGGTPAFVVSTSLSPWVLIHLLLAFLAFSVFLVSFVVGIAFIILESRRKGA